MHLQAKSVINLKEADKAVVSAASSVENLMIGDALRIGKIRTELDLTKPETIESAIPPDCNLVINCAAFTDVDGAVDIVGFTIAEFARARNAPRACSTRRR